MQRLLLAIALVCGSLPSAQAHDPGISRGDIQWQDGEMLVRLTFAQSLVEPLLASNRKGDRPFAPKEDAMVRTGLHAVIAAGVEVQDASKRLAPASVLDDQVTSPPSDPDREGADPRAASREQPLAERGFESLHAAGNRRLGQAEPLGRAVEAVRLDQVEEGFEKLDLHGRLSQAFPGTLIEKSDQ